jgi:hypothetical protein
MKKLILILSLLCARAEAQSIAPFWFEWDQPTNTIDSTTWYQVLSTTNALAPLNAWTVVSSAPLSILPPVTGQYAATSPTNNAYQVLITPTNNTMMFFTVGITNFATGTNFFYSNVAVLAAAGASQNSRLHR